MLSEEEYYIKFWDACASGNIETVKVGIKNINDVNKFNSRGWNAIILAAYNHHTEIIKFLLNVGADINSTNQNGTTVFMYAKTKALENDNYSVLELLLERGADINSLDKKNNWSVLDYVKETGNKKMVDFLISKGAK